MVPLTIEALRTFMAVAEAGSFTRAADRVCRTQSAVSVQMKSLEEFLGKPLFRRDRRGTVLNEHGELLLTYASRILRAHNDALTQFHQSDLNGTVRFGVPDDYAASILPVVMPRFRLLYPQVRLEIRSNDSRELRLALQNDELDMAVVSHEFSEEGASELLLDQLVWATAEGSNVYRERPLPLATHSETPYLYKLAVDALETAGLPYKAVLSGSNVMVLQAAASTGLAVAPLLETALLPGLVRVDTDDGLPSLPRVKACLSRSTRPLSAASERLVDLLISHYPGGAGVSAQVT